MLLKLFLAFTIIPVLEIYLLVEVGSAIGSINTVIAVLATGFLGAYLARLQGAKTMISVRENIQRGIMPANELIDAFLIFTAGIVLLTPGFITDLAGFLLLFPVSRNHLKRFLKVKFDHWIEKGNITFRNF